MNFQLTDALWGLAGGVMIGTAAALFLLLHGRISGVSGVLGALLKPAGTTRYLETVAFVAGIVAAPLIFAAYSVLPAIEVTTNTAHLIVAGLLVGLGSRMGNGCTSGHGVCGMSRFSRRSIIATATFMGVAVLVASFVSPVIGAL